MPPISRRTFVQASGLAFALPAIWTPSDARESEAAKASTPPRPRALDRIGFGDVVSEQVHGFAASGSSALVGALVQPARTLDPTEPAEVWGGTMRFRMKVDPARTTYVSVKLWGEDFGTVEQEWRLQLFVDGKAVGWFEQGPVDSLDQNSQEPRIAGQFYLHTIPLPETLTAGRTDLELEVRSLGRLWSYGNADNYYRAMTTSTRPIYAAYTHVDAYFVPAPDDVFGSPVAERRRADDSADAVALVRERVLDDQRQLLHGKPSASIDPWAWMTLALGYGWKDSPAYGSELALTKICEAIDANYVAWKANDAVLTASGQQWLGFGRVALALDTLWGDIEPLLTAQVATGSIVVPNAGFEAGTAGWSVQKWRGTGAVSADTEIVRSGAGAIRVVADQTAIGSVVGVTLGSGSRPLVGTGTYRVSVWCRAEAVTGVGPYLDVLFYDAAGAVLQADRKFFADGGTHDWQQITATLDVPAKAAAMRIDLRLEGAGTAWFDDVELVQTAGAPPQFPDMPVRRDAYREMLVASREFWRQNQRHYTNQVQFTSLGIYLCNKGLELLSPADAWPEERAREWIYEAVGLLPLSSGENADGSKKWKLGRDYRIYSAQGLSRELGYVGGYGEITGDLLTGMYEAVTRGSIRREDEKLRAHIETCLHARGWFRHEGFTADGERVMRLESIVGWRNEHYAGKVVYATPTDKDVNPMQAASVFPTAQLVGWTQEMIDDGQFGPILELLHTDRSSRIGLNAARFLMHDLPTFQATAASSTRLPAGWGRPDFLFADATAGVVALKRGDEVLYASLYWRARQAVNRWSRVHLLRPDTERSGTVVNEVEFGSAAPVGNFTIQDWVCWDYTINDSDGNGLFPGGFTPPGPALHQAYAGEQLPIARTPADMDPKLGATEIGVEAVESGRAPFYRLSYAGYHIAMNTTKDQTFAYKCPATGRGIDCATGRSVTLPKQRWVGPGETVVLFDPASRR
ncbi:carbohydrate binding domain-containing protein [Microbacterium sp. GXF0217]